MIINPKYNISSVISAMNLVREASVLYRHFDFYKSHRPDARAARAAVALRLYNEYPFTFDQFARMLRCTKGAISQYISAAPNLQREFPLIFDAVNAIIVK